MLTWQEAIKNFINYMKLERSFSLNTVDAYRRDLKKFTQFIDLQGIPTPPLEVKEPLVREFVGWLAVIGMEPKSQNRMLTGLRSFYKFLLMEDLLDENPTELVDSPKIPKKIPEVLAFDEIRRMFLCLDMSLLNSLRNRAMIETLYACGLRVTELCDLRMSGLSLDLHFIRVIGKNIKSHLRFAGRV